MNKTLPLVLTMGDPAGIGPEITAKAWQHYHNTPTHCFFIIADPTLWRDIPIETITHPQEATAVFPQALPILPLPLNAPVICGQPNPIFSKAIIQAIDQAVTFTKNGLTRAVITNPIAKNMLYQSGFTFPGHTEYLAHLDHKPKQQAIMMLSTQDLNVIPLTIHLPLKEVSTHLDFDTLYTQIKHIYHAFQQQLHIPTPRFALAALNPHAGECGTIGREEIDLLIPLSTTLQQEGLNITPPLPADSLFHEKARQTYDAVLCLYHDQALIPLKTLDFWGGVNTTLGLSFIRTSPDHGTAFDIAGKNLANPQSLINAIQQAYRLTV